jgi:flagellar FliJ protein
MARFVFRLQAVLRHRKAIEQEKQRDLAVAVARFEEIEGRLKALESTMRETNDDVRRNRLVGQLDVAFITAHRRFLLGMQRKAIELARELAAAQKDVDVARAALAEAAKQRMVLEKLREKQHARWREELDRKEVAAMDEVGMQLSVRDRLLEAKSQAADREVTR